MRVLDEARRKGVGSIKELVAFDEEEITDEIVQARLKDFVGQIDEIGKHYKKVQQLEEKLTGIVQKKKPKEHRRYRCHLGRAKVQGSSGIRNLKLPIPKPNRTI